MTSYYELAGSASAVHPNSIQGKLRVMPGGYLGDDTGYRRLIFDHDFPLFNLWATDEAEARRGLEATAQAGYHGSRILHRIVGEWDQTTTNPHNYWFGREVTPELFRAVRRPAMNYAKQIGLRLILTAGFRYGYSTSRLRDELDWADEVSGLIRDDGNADVVAWPEMLGNEVDVNRPELASDVRLAMAQARQLQTIWRRNLGCLISNGDFGQMSDVVNPMYPNSPTLLTSADGADLLDIHNDGDVKHAHGVWLSTHHKHSDPLARAVSEGEIGGENEPFPLFQQGGDCSHPQNDAHTLLAEVGIMLMTGQAAVYLNGPGVRRHYPIDSTAFFNQLPKAVSVIPDDVVTWRDENNPSWFIKGKEFVYAGLVSFNQLGDPPHPVASATFYGMDGPEGHGAGISLTPPSGWTGGIVRGTFV